LEPDVADDRRRDPELARAFPQTADRPKFQLEFSCPGNIGVGGIIRSQSERRLSG